MLNCVIDVRVSTDDQVKNFSLESQEKHCRDLAASKNLFVKRVFREEGVSAKNANGRPVLLELIRYCLDKKNDISTVIVYKYDRWSRNTGEGLELIALLAKQGVEVISATEPSENNAMGKAIRGMMLVWAELDNNIRSERTISGMKAAFENGHWPWQAPIGYAHTIVNGTRRV